MKKKLPPIIFFGTSSYSLTSLRALVEHGFDVVAVVTKPDSRSGRGHKLAQPPVKQFAVQRGIPVWQPTKLRDIAADIMALQPVAGVLVSYGKIIPQAILDLFTPGIINLHPSLLPQWRGPSPIESAIAHQNDITGVTLMQLSAQMDAGPIYCHESYRLLGRETKPALYEHLFAIGSQLLVRTLPAILSGELQPLAQKEDLASYCQPLSKKQSRIDPTTLSAAAAEAHVRAYVGFPRSRLTIAGRDLIITAAHPADHPEHPLAVQCRDGAYLVVDQLITPAGKTVSAADYLRGYPLT